MNPFDPNFKGQLPPPTAYERAAARNARKQSARRAEQLERDGPARNPTREQVDAARAKTARILKPGGL
ncbi:hypothetical protein [Roseateles chitosanitabidus]|uniref:hypothetical protein n=1 Tax=Roseateles chitosanitabidus TaxID=65048 RepID=UPI0008305FBF|nr:hypothetical protein [Roseateles chitosanitabidus]